MAEIDVLRRDTWPGPTKLWIEVLGAPIVWAVRFTVSYLLVPYACWWWGVWTLHLVTAVSLAITAGIGWAAYRDWRAMADATGVEPEAGRSRFMAFLGLLSSAFFFFVILAEGTGNFVIDPCLQSGAPIG